MNWPDFVWVPSTYSPLKVPFFIKKLTEIKLFAENGPIITHQALFIIIYGQNWSEGS